MTSHHLEVALQTLLLKRLKSVQSCSHQMMTQLRFHLLSQQGSSPHLVPLRCLLSLSLLPRLLLLFHRLLLVTSHLQTSVALTQQPVVVHLVSNNQLFNNNSPLFYVSLLFYNLISDGMQAGR